MTEPVVDLSGIAKQYGALRPLRIERLSVAPADSVAIIGLDQGAAEVFVNIVTGATLPESGEVRAFGRPTSAIADSDEWLAFVDRFGIVSERAVLLDPLSVIQNIAVPFTLDIEPPPDEVRDRAVALAKEVGLAEAALSKAVGELDAASRARVRVARALALNPGVLLIEHLTAGVPREEIVGLGQAIRTVAAQRGTATVTITADTHFAGAIAERVLTLEPATGRLRQAGAFGWFRGRLG